MSIGNRGVDMRKYTHCLPKCKTRAKAEQGRSWGMLKVPYIMCMHKSDKMKSIHLYNQLKKTQQSEKEIMRSKSLWMICAVDSLWLNKAASIVHPSCTSGRRAMRVPEQVRILSQPPCSSS